MLLPAVLRIHSFSAISNLMSVIFTKLPASPATPELVSNAGSLYMRWLRHIRHRGTFSSMATAFEHFLEAPALSQGLRRQWLSVSTPLKKHII